jgi:hypothetical protein
MTEAGWKGASRKELREFASLNPVFDFSNKYSCYLGDAPNLCREIF